MSFELSSKNLRFGTKAFRPEQSSKFLKLKVVTGIIRWRSLFFNTRIADFARIVSSQKTKATCFYFRRSSSKASFLSISA